MTSKENIACNLPSGLLIEVGDMKVALAGANSPDAKFGFGITRDVDADFFAAWSASVGEFPALKRGCIFAYAGEIEAAALERENDAAVRSGFEPLDPANPMPGIEPTEEMKKELEKAPKPAPKPKA